MEGKFGFLGWPCRCRDVKVKPTFGETCTPPSTNGSFSRALLVLRDNFSILRLRWSIQ
jgi:hypothetical protein